MTTDYKITSEPVNEDTVQCLFFSITLDNNKSSWEILCQEINNTIKTLSKDYIWNREEFQVNVPLLQADEEHPYLQSTTCFGDNIEDEWFIVHLILEISRQFKDFLIQITDNDGDFLLIEAADYLQAWANPENTVNRVFIYNGHVHIIPPEIIALDNKVDINTALNIINESPDGTVASTEIEHAILRRIGKYPEKILENRHRAVVKLPANLATLLMLKPTLIAPIVDAYCSHDIIDVRACKKVDFSDWVTIEVSFTKFLYAKLVHSKLISSVTHCKSQNDKKTILGLKLMCGYQMIMNKASTDIFSSKGYHQFINNLKKNGYFKNNIQGSKDYTILLEKAKEYFSIIECPISTSLAHNITQLMSSKDFLETKASIKDREVSDPQHAGDSEEWLNINPEQLNDLLMTRYGKTSKLKSNDVITSEALTTELSSFLKQTSDFEGIEPDRNGDNEDSHIEFESDQFAACLEKMLNIISSGADAVLSSEDNDSDFDDVDDIDDYDSELKAKLQDVSGDLQDNNNILSNIIQSMKEEKASSGPTSNLMRSIGLHKSHLLDSDDDVD